VLVITPAVGDTPDGVNATAFGVLKLARFSMLNGSVRNCKLSFSRRRVSLSKEKCQAGVEEMRPLVARERQVASVVAAGEAQLRSRIGSGAAARQRGPAWALR
jgi:hypothetical protein